MKLLVKVDNLNTGMYYHRLFTPFNALKESGVDVEATPVNDNGGAIVVRLLPEDYIKDFDAVVFSRHMDLDGTTQQTIDFLKKNGCTIAIDIDDYWDVDKSHYLYNNIEKYKINKQVKEAVSKADIVFTPTDYFTEECKKVNPNSYTVKTCIDTTHEQWQPREISSSLMRFGWIGGVHHIQDIRLLTNSMIRLHKDKDLQGKYQICLGGFSCEAIAQEAHRVITNSHYWTIEKILTNEYEGLDDNYKVFLDQFSRSLPDHISYHQPYRRLWNKPINEYGQLYDEVDVCLVPLSNLGHFNQFKSELKIIEAGTKGKMCIVSKVKPYTLIPEDCVHFISKNDNMMGWYEAIKYCVNNPEYVKDKAAKLQEYIKTNYVLELENEKRLKLIEG